MDEKIPFWYTKDHKKYIELNNLLEKHHYDKFCELMISSGFNPKNIKYQEMLDNSIKELILQDERFISSMLRYSYPNAFDYVKMIIKENPKIIDLIVENNYADTMQIINFFELGYRPSMEFIDKKHFLFNREIIISQLLDYGYQFKSNFVEGYFSSNFKYNSDLMIKALKNGYHPSKEFLQNDIFRNEKVLMELFKHYYPSIETLNDTFKYNFNAQKMIIDINPSLIYQYGGPIEYFRILWSHLLDKKIFPETMNLGFYSFQDVFASNYTLMSKMIKYKPEYIKYTFGMNEETQRKLDRLAISMGYSPTKDDIINTPSFRKSYHLMKYAINRRCEMIKYYEHADYNDFNELANLAIKNGYIPTISDLKNNSNLANNFDIMRLLIKENPQNVELCGDSIHNLNALMEYAISLGYSGSGNKIINNTEAMIKKVYLDKHVLIQSDKTNYSMELYEFLKQQGCSNEKIYMYFTNNFEVIKEIIKETPSLINSVPYSGLYVNLKRNEIDELCMTAINNGYIPTIDDKIFGYGLESIKYMIKKEPQFLYDCSLQDSVGIFIQKTIPEADEIFNFAFANGFQIDVNDSRSKRFLDNYYIAKALIEKEPSYITLCKVSDKKQYDELCHLALSLGYKPDRYAITHFGLNKNLEVMEYMVNQDVRYIFDAALEDKEEMVKLLDLAISNGLNLKLAFKDKLLPYCILLDLDYFKGKLDDIQIDILQKGKILYQNNIEIGNTIKSGFLQSPIIEQMTPLQVEIISCYPKIQEKFIKLSSDTNNPKYKLLIYILNNFQNDMHWITLIDNVMENIDSDEFSNLWNDLANYEVDNINYQKLLYLLCKGNHLDIANYNDLLNIDKIRYDYINLLIERNTVDSLKTAYFEKVYGISFDNANKLIQIYGETLNSEHLSNLEILDKELFVILNNIRNIMNINDVNVLKKYLENSVHIKASEELMIVFEQKLKEVYVKEFNKSFTKPLEEDRIIMNNDTDYDAYYAAGFDGKKKVRLMITSIGAYTSMDEPDDYYASWNMPLMKTHSSCCSYVGESNLGTAVIKYCCLGFTDYENGALLLSGPYDLCSYSQDEKYEVEAEAESMFLLPDDILDYTRHTHNETVWERRSIIGDKGLAKKQPSYIVYFVDNFEDRLTNDEAKRQWESVKKAASDFKVNGKNLPIMVVEREKIAQNERSKINEKLSEYMQTLNPSLIKDIVVKYENNYAGNREYHANISDKYFPQHKKLSDSVVGQIIEALKKQMLTNKDLVKENLIVLEQLIQKEKTKYDHTKHGVGVSLPSFNIEESLSVIKQMREQLKSYETSIYKTITRINEDNIQYEKSDKEKLSPSLQESQMDIDDVASVLAKDNLLKMVEQYEQEIYQEGINEGLKVHGERHIKNVLLYTALIGKQLLDNPNDLKLLMLSAKYHDISRKYDGNERHADESAQIAYERLKGKCSEQELMMIKTIIGFHEYDRRSENASEYFLELARKNGVIDVEKTRLLAEILKDADALDRTRFISSARIDPMMLNTIVSKRLVKFAANLQDTYALIDLEEFGMNDEIENLLNIYTPQELIRLIRKNTKNNTNISDIRKFILLLSEQTDIEQRRINGK